MYKIETEAEKVDFDEFIMTATNLLQRSRDPHRFTGKPGETSSELAARVPKSVLFQSGFVEDGRNGILFIAEKVPDQKSNRKFN